MDDLDMRPQVAKGVIGPCPSCGNVKFHREQCPVIPRDREIIHRNQEVKSKVEEIHNLLAELSTLRAERDALKTLIQHAWVHEGYRNCGYDYMTTEQKELYDSVKQMWAIAPRGPEGEG